MTRQEFIESHRHAILGVIWDLVYSRATGGELSMRISAGIATIDKGIGAMYDTLYPPNRPAPEPPKATPPAAPPPYGAQRK